MGHPAPPAGTVASNTDEDNATTKLEGRYMTAQAARQYVLGHSPAELRRLERQGAFYADFTQDLMRRAGIAAGMRVLDVGCGAGDVAIQAARLVGESGAVLGIDRAPEAVTLATARAQAAGLDWCRFEFAEIECRRNRPNP
jgi:2-polyprenyl-3-methyl-5-hydroxy-6-metoxy-1,4-benzoquinol methylase